MQTRKHNLDYLKVLAIICVVAIHVCDKLITSYGLITPNQWSIVNHVEAVARFCAPVFFMINGMLLLQKYEGEKWSVFYKRVFPKFIVAYLIITIMSLESTSHWFDTSYTNEDLWASLTNFTGFYHLWFFQILMIIYLLVPGLRLIIRFIHRAETYYLLDAFILFWLVTCILIPFTTTDYQLPETIFSSPLITLFFPYVGYFVFGYYLEYRIKPFCLKHKLSVLISGLIACAGMFLTTVTATLTLDTQVGTISSCVYYPYSLNVFLSAIGVMGIFLLMESIFKPNKIIRFLSEHSLIIFLVHPLVIGTLEFDYKMDIFATGQPLVEAFKLFTLALTISIVVAGVWKLIKVLTKKAVNVLLTGLKKPKLSIES